MLDGGRTACGDKNPIICGLTLQVLREPAIASASLLTAAMLESRRRRWGKSGIGAFVNLTGDADLRELLAERCP